MTMPRTAIPDLGKPEVAQCPICGASFKRTLVRFEFRGHLFGYFPSDVCKKGHDFLTEESDTAIEAIAEKLRLIGKRPAGRRAPGPRNQARARVRPSKG